MSLGVRTEGGEAIVRILAAKLILRTHSSCISDIRPKFVAKKCDRVSDMNQSTGMVKRVDPRLRALDASVHMVNLTQPRAHCFGHHCTACPDI